jgi:hypothetical protein
VTEPDTDIAPCASSPAACRWRHARRATLSDDQQVEIVFFAHDPNGHLQHFQLRAYYSENLSEDLLTGYASLAGHAAGGLPPAGPPDTQTVNNAATGPLWTGGTYRLVVPAAKFKETCCYTLWLYAVKRTYVGCGWPAHTNESTYSFMIKKV